MDGSVRSASPGRSSAKRRYAQHLHHPRVSGSSPLKQAIQPMSFLSWLAVVLSAWNSLQMRRQQKALVWRRGSSLLNPRSHALRAHSASRKGFRTTFVSPIQRVTALLVRVCYALPCALLTMQRRETAQSSSAEPSHCPSVKQLSLSITFHQHTSLANSFPSAMAVPNKEGTDSLYRQFFPMDMTIGWFRSSYIYAGGYWPKLKRPYVTAV